MDTSRCIAHQRPPNKYWSFRKTTLESHRYRLQIAWGCHTAMKISNGAGGRGSPGITNWKAWTPKTRPALSSNEFPRGKVMLTKCSNLSCPALFRYLDDGRLFHLESDLTTRPCTCSRVEYFWLCHRCSSTMMLRLRKDGTVVTVLLPEPIRPDPDGVALTSTDRDKGLSLRSVSSPCARAPWRS